MSEQATGHRRLADVVDALEAMGASVGESKVNRARDGDVHVSLTADLSEGITVPTVEEINAGADEELAELQQQRDELFDSMSEKAEKIQKLKGTLREMRAERDGLREDIGELQDERDRLQERSEQLAETINAQATKIAELQDDRDDIDEQRDASDLGDAVEEQIEEARDQPETASRDETADGDVDIYERYPELPEHVLEAMETQARAGEPANVLQLGYEERHLDVEFPDRHCGNCEETGEHRIETDSYREQTITTCRACGAVDAVDPVQEEPAEFGGPEERRGFILDVLEDHDEVPGPELRDRVDVSKGTLSNDLAALEADGEIEVRPDPGEARRKLYALADAGEDDVQEDDEEQESSADETEGGQEDADNDPADSRQVIVHSNDDTPLTTYHEDPECRYAQRIDDPREVPLDELDDVDPCGSCEGGVDEKDSDLDEDELREAYEEHDGVVARVAEAFDADYTAVYTRLRGLGIHEAGGSSGESGQEEDAPEDVVYATTGAGNSGTAKRYHEDEDCRGLQQANNYHAKPRDSVPHHEPCAECAVEELGEDEVLVCGNGGSTYHRSEDCPTVEGAKNAYLKALGEIEGYHPCGRCAADEFDEDVDANGGAEEIPEECDWLELPADAIVEDSGIPRDLEEVLRIVETADGWLQVHKRTAANKTSKTKSLLFELGLREAGGGLLEDDVLEERVAAIRRCYVA